MTTALKLRRGTTAQHASFTGAAGEVTVDTTKKTAVVHDGATAGGIPLARASDALVTGVQFTQSGTGAATRTLDSRLKDVISVKDFGAVGDGSTDDTTAILAAITAATAANKSVVVPSGTYKLSGSTTLSIDVGKMSLIGQGSVQFNCSAMTATNAIQVFSSLTYPNSHFINTGNKVSGIVFTGGHVSGRHGLLIGHATHENNCQTVIEGCSFYYFDRAHHFMDNSWRTVFRDCVFQNALTYTLYVPSGLANAGESVAYYHCMFNDGAGKLTVATLGFQIFMYSCSILNQAVELTGTSAKIAMFGGNMENPANPTPYTYVTVSGSNAVFSMDGTGLVTNPVATFTDAIFNISNSQSTISFRNIIWPDGANLQFETSVGWRTFCKGPGRVVLDGNSFWPASGGEKCPVSKTANALYNGDLETGNMNGWTVTTYGTAGSTAVSSATAKKNGSYGMLVTTVAGGGINITQKVKVRPGQLCQVFAWARVATGSGTVTYFQYRFYDALGNQISVGGDGISSTSWARFGTSLTLYAPAGAETFEITINGQPGTNVIYYDDIIVNIH